MKKSEIEQTVRQSLSEVAPEVEPDAIDPDRNFRDQFDFDSMDYLALMMDLNEKFGIRISEIDYPKVSSLSACVAHLDEKLRAGNGNA